MVVGSRGLKPYCSLWRRSIHQATLPLITQAVNTPPRLSVRIEVSKDVERFKTQKVHGKGKFAV